MRYVNADIIFPEELLNEIQKYMNGELVYVPKSKALRKKLGWKFRQQKNYNLRNDEIRRKFLDGDTIEKLSDRFCLSSDTIKRSFIQNNSLTKVALEEIPMWLFVYSIV